MKPSHRVLIYRNRWHLVATFGVVLLPFVFLLAFAHTAGLVTSALFADVFVSIVRLAIAYAMAAAIGWMLAVTTAHGPIATIALPTFDVLQSFPTFAALPLATLAWGASNTTIIIVLVVTIIWPILFSVTSACKLGKRDWAEAVQIAGLRGWPYVRQYLWPLTVPGLVTGSIVGIGEGWEALIATEMIIGARRGLGAFFPRYAHNPTITAFGILGFLLIIFSVNKLIWIPLLDWSHARLAE